MTSVVALLIIAVCGLPIIMLAITVFDGDAGALVQDAWASRSVRRALWHSVESSTLSAFLATTIGALLALSIALTNIRAKGVLTFALLLPLMIPPHVTAIAWVQTLGPASPVLSALGIAPSAGGSHPLYSREGLVALLTLQHMPLAFLVVRASLRNFPREMVDAARAAGAQPWRVLLRIVVPLLAPSLTSAFGLAFVAALGNFGINALIGIPARYTTLPVLIWRRLAAFGPDILPQMATIAMLTVIVTLVALGMQRLFSARPNALLGLPQAPLAFSLGRSRVVFEVALWSFVAFTLALPAASLVATAMVPTYGVGLTLGTITFENFAEVLWRQDVTLRAFFNSTLAAGVAGVVIALIAILLGREMLQRAPLSRLAGALGEIAFALPGIVMGVGFILVFIRPLPLIGSLYGTLTLIGIAYIAVFLTIGLKPVASAFGQLDAGLDEAARTGGANAWKRLIRIAAPLVAPSAVSGAILVFLTAYNEITVSALLWSSGSETIGTTIFNYEDGGYTTLAAAMSVIVVIATVLGMLAMNMLAPRVPSGTIPWKD